MPERTIYDLVEFNEKEFRCSYLKRIILWKDVVRVAYANQVFPDELWFENFRAFQTNDPEILISVEAESISGMRFSDEIRRRYNVTSIPAPKDWTDNEFLIKTYVVYPEADFGKPLYKWTKKHWYSSDYEIEFYQT